MQMAAGVAEHDPGRRLARGTRYGNRGRLSRRQYRLEPLDCGFVPHALLSGHHHVEAIGLVNVVDQSREVLTELRSMAGHRSYVRRLDRHHSGNGERCGRCKNLHVITRYSRHLPLPGVIEAVAQHTVVEPLPRMRSLS